MFTLIQDVATECCVRFLFLFNPLTDSYSIIFFYHMRNNNRCCPALYHRETRQSCIRETAGFYSDSSFSPTFIAPSVIK